MKNMSEGRRPEDCGFDRETWKNVLMDRYQSELNDPELRDLLPRSRASSCRDFVGRRTYRDSSTSFRLRGGPLK